MKKIITFLKFYSLSVALMLSLSACSFLSQKPYQKVNYFTLGNNPSFKKSSYNIDIKVFNSLLPEKFRMIYIKNQYQVYIDDYNKWIQPPEFMLKKYLSNKFANQSQKNNFIITGTIENFDIDTDKFMARMNVTYKITDKNKPLNPICIRQLNKTKKFDKLDPKDFAKAFTMLSEELANDIRISINDYLKEAKNENK